MKMMKSSFEAFWNDDIVHPVLLCYLGIVQAVGE